MRPPQPVATLGVALKTDRRCKVCLCAEHRGELEDLLTLRSEGGVTADGTRVTEALILDNAMAWFGVEVSKAGLQRHFANHYRTRAAATVAVRDSAVDDELRELALSGELRRESVPGVLDEMISMGIARLRANPKLATPDLLLRAIGLRLKGEHDARVGELMNDLGQSISTALRPPAARQVEIPAADVVDAEVVEPPGEGAE